MIAISLRLACALHFDPMSFQDSEYERVSRLSKSFEKQSVVFKLPVPEVCTKKPADRTPQRNYCSLYWKLTAGLQGDIITADNGLTSYALGYKLSYTQPVAEQTYCVGD